MFFRMLKGALTRRGNRHAMIALTVALGACVATSMLSVMFNVGDKVNQELKSYGANIVVRPQGAAVLQDLYSTQGPAQHRLELRGDLLGVEPVPDCGAHTSYSHPRAHEANIKLVRRLLLQNNN